jgi:hypothetical protein
MFDLPFDFDIEAQLSYESPLVVARFDGVGLCRR